MIEENFFDFLTAPNLKRVNYLASLEKVLWVLAASATTSMKVNPIAQVYWDLDNQSVVRVLVRHTVSHSSSGPTESQFSFLKDSWVIDKHSKILKDYIWKENSKIYYIGSFSLKPIKNASSNLEVIELQRIQVSKTEPM